MTPKAVADAIAAADTALGVMGTTTAVLLSAIVAGTVTQLLKMLIPVFREPCYTISLRLFALSLSFALTANLNPNIPLFLALVLSPLTLVMYHAGTSAIRHFWPWLEVNPFIGSTTPPQKALDARADRALVAELERQDQ